MSGEKRWIELSAWEAVLERANVRLEERELSNLHTYFPMWRDLGLTGMKEAAVDQLLLTIFGCNQLSDAQKDGTVWPKFVALKATFTSLKHEHKSEMPTVRLVRPLNIILIGDAKGGKKQLAKFMGMLRCDKANDEHRPALSFINSHKSHYKGFRVSQDGDWKYDMSGFIVLSPVSNIASASSAKDEMSQSSIWNICELMKIDPSFGFDAVLLVRNANNTSFQTSEEVLLNQLARHLSFENNFFVVGTRCLHAEQAHQEATRASMESSMQSIRVDTLDNGNKQHIVNPRCYFVDCDPTNEQDKAFSLKQIDRLLGDIANLNNRCSRVQIFKGSLSTSFQEKVTKIEIPFEPIRYNQVASARGHAGGVNLSRSAAHAASEEDDGMF